MSEPCCKYWTDKPFAGPRKGWTVQRRGRPAADWRILSEHFTDSAALDAFATAFVGVRQGALAVVSPEGVNVKINWEPMARSRW